MLVPRGKQDEVVAIAKATAEGISVGPGSSDAMLGPLVSATQRDRVRGYIQKGIDEGATLVTGGVDAPEGLDKGYFVKPTIFSDVTSDMTIAQEEIFGPVLVIMPYDDEDEAVEIANSTIYGLAGGVQSADLERAKAFARRLRTGQVEINGGGFNIQAPFGGYKQSGNGRELGKYGLEEFTRDQEHAAAGVVAPRPEPDVESGSGQPRTGRQNRSDRGRAQGRDLGWPILEGSNLDDPDR